MSERGSASSLSRRDFLKLLSAGGIAMAFAPFVQWGKFMPNPQANKLERAKVILPDGTHANINTFPINHAEVITYPSTGDIILDQEAFRKWQIIRLPKELGGETNDVSAFRDTAMSACIYGACGNIGTSQAEREWNVHVMEASMMCQLVWQSGVLHLYRLRHQTFCQSWIWNLMVQAICILYHQYGIQTKTE